jgi:hypothetical protein
MCEIQKINVKDERKAIVQCPKNGHLFLVIDA